MPVSTRIVLPSDRTRNDVIVIGIETPSSAMNSANGAKASSGSAGKHAWRGARGTAASTTAVISTSPILMMFSGIARPALRVTISGV
jgi:hypothetical protein